MLQPITNGTRVLFSVQELACSHCGEGKLAPGFDCKLRKLRIKLDRPMLLNSACRCAEYNNTPRDEGGVGGHKRSLHVFDNPHWPTNGTCAVDVRTRHWSNEEREELAALALALGWSVGYGNGFLHLDRRSDYTYLPQTEFNY